VKGRLLLDVRYALRNLRRNPAFAVVAIAVLAVGIGVNTASFGLIDALLLKPPPVAAPDELVRVSASGMDGAISYADLLTYRAEVRSLSGLAAFTADTLALRFEGDATPERVGAYLVSDDYFSVLGVAPTWGRAPSTARNGEPPRVVLGDAYWKRRFGGDTRILGRTVWLNGTSFVIGGVAPVNFNGTMRGGRPQVYVPYAAVVPRESLEARGRRTLIGVGRLAGGATVEAAQSEIGVVGRRLAAAFPDTNRGVSPTVGPESTAIFREAPQLVYVVIASLGMSFMLLLLACVNLAGLLTARGTFREREIVIRAMHGATSRVIAGQLLTESLVLGAIGGVAGLAVGVFARNVLWRELQASVAEYMGLDALWIDTRVDLRVALFALVVSLASVVAFGLLPALHASRLDLYGRAKEGAAASPAPHLARLGRLVVVQVAVSAVLLACAGLLLQAVRSATSVDLGYPLDREYVADLDLSGVDKGRAQPVLAALTRDVRELPGVEAAAVASGGGPGYLPQSMTPGRSRQNYVLTICGPEYFHTLRVPVLSGREFDETETREPVRVAILNQRLAEALWPGEDAVGRQLRIRDDEPSLTVVGVVKTVRSFPIGPPFFQLYVPIAQRDLSTVTLHVRTSPGRAPAALDRLLQELRRSPSGLATIRVRALSEWATSVLAVPRAMVRTLASLGAVALFLAAIGLYGLTAYSAGRRARECAVRLMLGASRATILWLLLRTSMKTVLAGLAVGGMVSLMVGWSMKAVLLGAAFDPVALILAPSTLAATAFAAIARPAFRAAHVDPMALLRDE
jgi:predicted permease